MNIALIRGKHLNQFEIQNYLSLGKSHNLTLIGSKNAIHKNFPVKTILLNSPADLPNFPKKMSVLNRIFTDAHFLFGLEKYLSNQDIIHVAETYYYYTHQAIQAKKKSLAKKIVSTVWETIPHNNEGIRGRKKLKEESKKHIDLFICPTKKAKSCLIKEGFDPQKIAVVPIGIDLKRFAPKTSQNKDKTKILTICRLEEEKGILPLLKAFNKLNKTNPQTSLTVIGRGSLKKNILSFLKKHSLQKSVTLKTVPYNKIHLEYQKVDIFVLNSQTTKHWEEQYGMCLIEAMASSLPITSTKTGAIPEVLSKNNLLVSPKKPNHLFKSLLFLTNNPKIRKKIGKENRNFAQIRYNHIETAKKIEKLYKNLLKS